MSSTIHVHVDPHFSGWLVRLQELNGSWANIDADTTDAGSDVTFIYDSGYPATLRAYLPAQSRGGDDYDEDWAPTPAGLTFYEEQEVWFTLNPDVIPPEEAVTMIGGPTGFTWGTPTAGVSIVRITTDGGLTWSWGVATGTIVIPHGGPTSWIWKAFTL